MLVVADRVIYTPEWEAAAVDMSAWVVVRDATGRWCVESRLPWPCRVCLTSAFTITDDRLEERARAVAQVLNRVYAR